MRWLRIGFERAMSHAVPLQLVERLVYDMAERGHPIEDFEKKYGADHARSLGGNPKAIHEWMFDVGGFYRVGMPDEVLDIDGLSISVPCDMLGDVLHRASRSEARRFSDGTLYHKLKFWCHATVLTVPQYREVMAQLSARESLAMRRAEAFLASIRKAAN